MSNENIYPFYPLEIRNIRSIDLVYVGLDNTWYLIDNKISGLNYH